MQYKKNQKYYTLETKRVRYVSSTMNVNLTSWLPQPPI